MNEDHSDQVKTYSSSILEQLASGTIKSVPSLTKLLATNKKMRWRRTLSHPFSIGILVTTMLSGAVMVAYHDFQDQVRLLSDANYCLKLEIEAYRARLIGSSPPDAYGSIAPKTGMDCDDVRAEFYGINSS